MNAGLTKATANSPNLVTRDSLQSSPRKEALETLIEIDHAAERRLVRKLDLHIIPIVMLLYLFSFLDRQVFLFIWNSYML